MGPGAVPLQFHIALTLFFIPSPPSEFLWLNCSFFYSPARWLLGDFKLSENSYFVVAFETGFWGYWLFGLTASFLVYFWGCLFIGTILISFFQNLRNSIYSTYWIIAVPTSKTSLILLKKFYAFETLSETKCKYFFYILKFDHQLE